MIINIAEGDTIIFNFPLSIFNSAAVRLPGKLKFEVPSAAMVECINHRFLPQFVTNWPSGLPDKLEFECVGK